MVVTMRPAPGFCNGLYGAMTLLQDAGDLPPDCDLGADAPGSNLPPVDYFTSGLTEEQFRRMQDMPERVLLFDYLRRIPGTLRIPDLASHTVSLGMAEFTDLPVGPFLIDSTATIPPRREL